MSEENEQAIGETSVPIRDKIAAVMAEAEQVQAAAMQRVADALDDEPVQSLIQLLTEVQQDTIENSLYDSSVGNVITVLVAMRRVAEGAINPNGQQADEGP